MTSWKWDGREEKTGDGGKFRDKLFVNSVHFETRICFGRVFDLGMWEKTADEDGIFWFACVSSYFFLSTHQGRYYYPSDRDRVSCC